MKLHHGIVQGCMDIKEQIKEKRSGRTESSIRVICTQPKVDRNRPYSYSHGSSRNEHEGETDAGESFQMQIIPPHEPPSHARSSPTVRIRIRSIECGYITHPWPYLSFPCHR